MFVSCGFILIVLVNVSLGKDEELCMFRLKHKNVDECKADMSYTPWPDDENCMEYKVRLATEKSWKPRALLVLPWSGNAGLGHMIEQSTGYYVGYIMPHLARNGSVEEENDGRNCVLRRPWDGRTIVQKTNHFFEDMTADFVNKRLTFTGKDITLSELSTIMFDYRGIVVIRNPWNVLHEYRYILRRSERSCCIRQLPAPGTLPIGFGRLAQHLDWDQKGFEKYMVKAAKNWVNTLKTWIKETPSPKDLLIIRYEKLIENPMPELIRVLNYLNVPVDQGRLNCIQKYPPVRNFSIPEDLTEVARRFVRSSEVANRILSNGIIQINTLFRQRGIDQQLNFTP